MTPTSPASRIPWPSALPSILFIITFVMLFWVGMPLFADPDTPWHIASGDLILHNGKLPATDPWSFTAGGTEWYIISWLWDVMLSAINSIAGLKGIYFCVLVLTSLTAGLLASNVQQRNIASDALIFTLFFAGLGLIEYTAARPQIVAYLCVLIFHRLLHNSRQESSLHHLYWLPVLMLIWVNVHGSFFAGFTLIGAYGLEAIIYKRWDWLKRLFIIGVACVVAALCNPYGIHMYDATMRTLHSVITQYIVEWEPFIFSNSLGTSAWVAVFVLSSGLQDKDIPPADKIISVLWWLAMMFSMRNGSIFILVSAPYVALSLQRWLVVLDNIRTRRPDALAGLSKPGMARNMALAAALVVAVHVLMVDALKPNNGYLVNKDTDPGPAIRFVQDHYAGKYWLNDYDFGGRFIYETRGRVPIFIDGRAGTAYPENVLSDFIDINNIKEGWQDKIASYHVYGILLANKEHFVTAYDDGQYHDKWKEVYHDDVASVFVRK